MESYPAVYDFGLLPFALGDALTWNVKACIRAQKNNCPKLDILICLDSKTPASMVQDDYIDQRNYWHFYNELQPVFLCNPMLNRIQIFRDRTDLVKYLDERLNKHSNSTLSAYYSEYLDIVKKRKSSVSIRKYFRTEITGHEDIIEYYNSHKTIPYLKVDIAFQDDVINYKNIANNQCLYVATNFRSRFHDESSKPSQVDRDSNPDEWLNFYIKCEQDYPHIKFILLGKIEEKPPSFLKLKNVILPRTDNQTLGHELAWIVQSDLFIGTSSGFAAMAYFSEGSYYITKMNPSAYDAYCVKPGDTIMPFGKAQQYLDGEAETCDNLYGLLSDWLSANKLTDRAKEPLLESSNEVKQYIDTPKRIIAMDSNLITILDLINLEKNGDFLNIERALTAKLYKTLVEGKEIAEFHRMSALILFEKGLTIDAKKEILIALEKCPDCEKTKSLAHKINCKLLVHNLDAFSLKNPDSDENFLGIDNIKAKAYLDSGDYKEADKVIKSILYSDSINTDAQKIEKELLHLFSSKSKLF